jgi:hypothetical protein
MISQSIAEVSEEIALTSLRELIVDWENFGNLDRQVEGKVHDLFGLKARRSRQLQEP